MHRLWKDHQGNFVVAFALLSFVIFGGVGVAIDYSRAVNVESFMQAQADAGALGGVQFGKEGDPSPYLQFIRASTEGRYGDWIEELQVKGDWTSATDFEVTVKGEVPVSILAGVPGFPDAVPVSVQATARLAEPVLVYKPPRVSQLDPEASDYNRISVYCYDPEKHGGPKNGERTQMTVIADNAGTKYDYKMPRCEEGQYLSYKLLNVRDARTKRSLWDDKDAEHYEYYTDTELKHGREKYQLHKPILETVLCDSFEKCKPESQGGVIPEGKMREPRLTKKACEPGKFMYYGWEDRPPGNGWTDRDYDDIRIVIECPSVEVVGNRTVRLVN